MENEVDPHYWWKGSAHGRKLTGRDHDIFRRHGNALTPLEFARRTRKLYPERKPWLMASRA